MSGNDVVLLFFLTFREGTTRIITVINFIQSLDLWGSSLMLYGLRVNTSWPEVNIGVSFCDINKRIELALNSANLFILLMDFIERLTVLWVNSWMKNTYTTRWSQKCLWGKKETPVGEVLWCVCGFFVLFCFFFFSSKNRKLIISAAVQIITESLALIKAPPSSQTILVLRLWGREMIYPLWISEHRGLFGL